MVSRRIAVGAAADSFHVIIYVALPAEDFYGFIKEVNIVSALCVFMTLSLMVRFVFEASKLRSLKDTKAWTKVAGPVGAVLAISAVQLMLW